MRNAIKSIEEFQPTCEQEEVDKALFLEVLRTNEKCLTRESLLGHFTVSAWVMNRAKTHVLCVNHNILGGWRWIGGHCDGDDDFLAVITREIEEETGLEKFELYEEGIFSIQTLCVQAHRKNGKYVPSHVHLDVAYVFVADEGQQVRIQEEENSGVAWKTFEELIAAVPKNYASHTAFRKIVAKIRQ